MIPAIHSDIIPEVPVSPIWQPQSKDNFQYDTGTYVHQAVLPNLKIDTGLMSATLARPVRPCFTQSHSLFHHSLFSSPFFLTSSTFPKARITLHKSLSLQMCLHVCMCWLKYALLCLQVCLFQWSQIPPAGNRVSALR